MQPPETSTDSKPVSLEEIRRARERIAEVCIRTPLVRWQVEESPAEIHLKLENLQPLGSFKLRGATSAMIKMPRHQLDRGVWTASAGNMALSVAWLARRMGFSCTAVMPQDAPAAKVNAVRKLGASVLQVPFVEYQDIQRDHRCDRVAGTLIHPFADSDVIAGNGTIALEILEDLPDVDAVVVPFGGGGLSCGIASAVRASRPGVKVYACEVENAAPLAASLAAGRPVTIDFSSSFVSGMGAPFVFPRMWPVARDLLDGSLVAPVEEIAASIRLLAERNRIIAEGAGAVAPAVALSGKVGGKKIVAIVSGGVIDTDTLLTIPGGEHP